MTTMTTLNVASQFGRFPGGRFRRISEYSGEEFREQYLEPVIKDGGKAVVVLDGVAGYGSSFLEEVFGGIVRAMRWLTREEVNRHLVVQTTRPSWLIEVNQYIDDELIRQRSGRK